MKRLIILLLISVAVIACNNMGVHGPEAYPQPEISDLQINGEARDQLAARRQAILDTIGEGILVIRSDYGFNGGRHEYRAASNFWYLTGYSQPGAIISLSGSAEKPYAFYTGDRSIREIIYSGNLPGQSELIMTWNPDTVMDYSEADRMIAESARKGHSVFVDFRDRLFREHVTELLKGEKDGDSYIKDIGPSLAEMRVIKDDYEVGLLQKAVNLTGDGLSEVLRVCRPGMYEFEIEALLEYTWRRSGSSMPGFESIVGSGENAVTLHYSANNRKMEDGDLLLMDIGAEYGYYTADITRTIPVNGKFSKEQKDIYNLVLGAQEAAIGEMQPGNPMTAAHTKATEIIINGLHDIGLVTDPDCLWQRKFYTIYHINHYLGLDVHDAGSLGIPSSMMRSYLIADTSVGRPLEKGMVLTVEPGIYLRANGLDQLEMLFGNEAGKGEIEKFIEQVGPVYKRYQNIGVRIEDDVLITETGNRVLSDLIPKEAEAIERAMAEGQKRTR